MNLINRSEFGECLAYVAHFLYILLFLTDIMIKPDGVQRGIVGEIIKRFEQKGYKLVAMKLTAPGKEHMEQHYIDLKDKKFFPGLITYMTSGPVVAMVWEGKGAVLEGRKMLGATMPSDSAPGTIRGDYALEVGRNICHGSDSVDSANAEIALWFPEGTSEWESCAQPWIYENA
jgi:nucleoside-diphosphate kinase